MDKRTGMSSGMSDVNSMRYHTPYLFLMDRFFRSTSEPKRNHKPHYFLNRMLFLHVNRAKIIL